jgi:uncharacterized protein (DUF1778 family)
MTSPQDSDRSRTRYRVEVKLSQDEKNLISKAAALSGVGISAFVRGAAERAAREVVSARKQPLLQR